MTNRHFFKPTAICLALLGTCCLFSSQALTVDTNNKTPKCKKILDDINDIKDDKRLKQLEAIHQTKKCLSYSTKEGLTNQLLTQEAERLYQIAIRPGETAEFDAKQMARLQPYKTYIDALMHYQTTPRKMWLLATLQLVLSRDEMSLIKKAQQSSTILMNYNYYEQNPKEAIKSLLPKFVTQSKLGDFVASLNQRYVNQVITKGKQEQLAQQRGTGESPYTQFIIWRSQFAPVNLNALIEFVYDEDIPTKNGEQEYKEALKSAQSNTTKKLLIIGHASPKGKADYNCKLSKKRATAIRQRLLEETDLSADKITIAWAGENIPLDSGQATKFLSKDIAVAPPLGTEEDPSRRRVEFEINGTTKLTKYKGKLCQ